MLATNWVARIAILTLAHVVGTLHIVSVMAMAPVIQQELGLSITEVGLLVTGYYGAQTLGAVPAGGLADRIGVGWALVVSHALLAGGALVFSRAGGFGLAIAGTIVMGFGYTIVNPATAKGVLTWFSARRRATAMGVKQTGVPIGGVLAAGNGALVIVMSWQSILLVITAVTVISALLCALLIEPNRESSTISYKTVLRHLFRVGRYPNIRLIFFASIPWNMGQTNFFTYLTLFMRESAAASQPIAGLVLAIAQASSALGRIGWGVVSDTMLRGSRKTLIVALCGTSALFMAAMAAVGPVWGVWLGIGLALALGLTIASFAPLSHTLAVEAVEPAESGSAMGYSLMGTSIGGVIGPPVFGAIVDYTGDFADGWIAMAVFVAIGTILVAVRYRERPGS